MKGQNLRFRNYKFHLESRIEHHSLCGIVCARALASCSLGGLHISGGASTRRWDISACLNAVRVEGMHMACGLHCGWVWCCDVLAVCDAWPPVSCARCTEYRLGRHAVGATVVAGTDRSQSVRRCECESGYVGCECE